MVKQLILERVSYTVTKLNFDTLGAIDKRCHLKFGVVRRFQPARAIRIEATAWKLGCWA